MRGGPVVFIAVMVCAYVRLQQVYGRWSRRVKGVNSLLVFSLAELLLPAVSDIGSELLMLLHQPSLARRAAELAQPSGEGS